MMSSEEYKRSLGTQCPYCESRNLEDEAPSEFTGTGDIETKVTCEDCGKSWLEVYRLAGFRILPEGEE
jgi:transposase-like protein